MAKAGSLILSAVLVLWSDGAAAYGGACAVKQQRGAEQRFQQPRHRQPAMMAGRGRGRGRGYRPQPVIDTTPINGAIMHDEMRVMLDVGGGNDEMLGVMSKDEALQAARDRELDLVLIAGKSDPPVVKIVSYDKFRFAKEKKRKEQQKAAARGKSELKELKMSYKIGDHGAPRVPPARASHA